MEDCNTLQRKAKAHRPLNANSAADAAENIEKQTRLRHPHPLTYRPQDLADRLGITRRYLYDLLKHPDPAHRLPAPFKIGRATFWRVEDVQGWIDRQAGKTA